jgi:hypothetical protein
MNHNVTIRLAPSYSGPAELKVDVIAENVPKNLFGAAFHLNITGGEWKMINYTNGNVFKSFGDFPLILAKEKVTSAGKEIVFGITMKRGDPLAAEDGVLSSFLLKVDPVAKFNLNVSDIRLVTSMAELRGIKGEAVSVDMSSLAVPVVKETVALTAYNPKQTAQSDVFMPSDLFDVYLIMTVVGGSALVVFVIYALVKKLIRRE